MTANRGLFVRNLGAVGTSPTDARLALAGLLAESAPGVPRPGLLFQAAEKVVTGTGNMDLRVAPCQIVTVRDAGEGAYLMSINGTTPVPLQAAPATGARIDIVYAIQHDPDKGDATNDADVEVLPGTVATSPTSPASGLPAGAFVLAEVRVEAGAKATNAAGVTVVEKWQYTALRGAPIPVRNQAEVDSMTRYKGLTIRRLDLTGAPEMVWSGVSWYGANVRPFAHAGMTQGFVKTSFHPTTNEPTRVPVSPQIIRGGIQSVNGGLVVPETGLYRITAKYYASGGYNILCTGDVWINGSTTSGANQAWWKQDSNDYMGSASVVRELNAGDSLELRGTAGPASFWGTNGFNGSFIEVEWVGPREPWS